MSPSFLTTEQSRRVDQLAIERYGMSSLVLMENAGRGAAESLLDFDPKLVETNVANRVIVLCGKGNNAGDGFVLARHLEIRHVDALIVLLVAPEELSADAQHNYQILERSEDLMVDFSRHEDPTKSLDEYVKTSADDWIVDAMLGTGAQGAPRPPYDAAIEWMNAQPARRLALDLPSGLNADTGVPATPTVRADLTCTFVAPKVGFRRREAQECLGEERTISIGVPSKLLADF